MLSSFGHISCKYFSYCLLFYFEANFACIFLVYGPHLFSFVLCTVTSNIRKHAPFQS